MSKEKEIELVRKSIEDYIKRNKLELSTQELSSFIRNGTDILCEKWRVGYAGHAGSFATAVANNDLMGAFAYADHINIGLMKDYTLLLYNAKYPTELLHSK